MKNDLTTTFLNFLLAALVLACVVLAFLNLSRTHQIGVVQSELITSSQRAQALARDVISYNATAKSPELQQILQNALNPQPAK